MPSKMKIIGHCQKSSKSYTDTIVNGSHKHAPKTEAPFTSKQPQSMPALALGLTRLVPSHSKVVLCCELIEFVRKVVCK